MTFDKWLETLSSLDLKETAKQIEVKLFRMVELAWRAGHDIGYNRGHSVGYQEGYESGHNDRLGKMKLWP